MATKFETVSDLEAALTRAAEAHDRHEAEVLGGVRDEEWPAWYAEYMVREQAGEELPS